MTGAGCSLGAPGIMGCLVVRFPYVRAAPVGGCRPCRHLHEGGVRQRGVRGCVAGVRLFRPRWSSVQPVAPVHAMSRTP